MHQSLVHKFLGNVSIVLRTGCRVSHLAVIPPPGIILFSLVYFFGPFSVPEEGVAPCVTLASRGVSKLEDALTEMSSTFKGSGSVGVFGVSSNLGPLDLITGGSIGALEGGVTGVVSHATGVCWGWVVDSCPVASASTVCGCMPVSGSLLLWDPDSSEWEVGMSSGTRARMANGVMFGVMNISAL